MNWSNNLYLRWAATAVIVLLIVVIGVRWLGREQPSDAASLLNDTPVSGADALALQPEQAVISAAATTAPAAEQAAAEQIAVDVIGAVVTPGVYRLRLQSRVEDAVTAAGGLAPDANRELINLAAPVEDGSQIRVPRVGEAVAAAEPGEQAASSGQAAAAGGVDINTADAAGLEGLPGVGPATAAAIVAYREANGPFQSVEELQKVKGIGPSLFGKLVGLITVTR